MDEFEIIRRWFSTSTNPDWLTLGIGDDAALLSGNLCSSGQDFVLATDTLIAGRHFADHAEPSAIGWKSLAVNLSDLAAMGATPRAFLLALTLPEATPEWLDGFAEGLHELAALHDVALVGGDTTRGPLSITITALGIRDNNTRMRRDGARPGDAVWVSGTLGDAALALRLGSAAPKGLRKGLRNRLDRPVPRVAEGMALAGQANAAIDISDGLAADLGHILTASGVGAQIDSAALPASAEFDAMCPPADRQTHQLSGGDDYELCVCLPASVTPPSAECGWTRIGEIVAEPGLRLQSDDRIIELEEYGYRHFD